ncbi:MAG: hypothetical protein R3E39_20985 [Anaerolineae bacterium]
MDKKLIFQAAAIASVVAFIAVIIQATAGLSLPQGVQVQPGFPIPLDQFVRASNEYPDTALGFFGADSLFVLSYILVFVGLYTVTSEHARPFALIGLGTGIFTALMDATENAFFINYALGAKTGLPLTTPDVPLIYIITNLKWMGAFATLYAFGLVFPRSGWLSWLINALMLLFPIVGVLGVANPSLVVVRGLFFLLGMPLFALFFWQRSRSLTVN